MVRYTIALRGAPMNVSSPFIVHEENINVFNNEQLTEHYLCEVNPKGQVIITRAYLTVQYWNRDLDSSLDITFTFDTDRW